MQASLSSSSSSSFLRGIWVPLVTPFAPSGGVDTAALAALTRTLCGAGVHGLVVCGTTGEAATLSDEEQLAVLDTVQQACGATPLLVGASGVAPADVAAQCRRAARPGVAGFLVPPPLYVRPGPAGVAAFYAAVAAAVAPRALVVYDIPYRTGVELGLPLLRALAREHANIAGIKDCGGDARKTQALIADGALAVLAGEDAQIFTTLCQGGAGAIAASAHLHPRHFVALYDALQQGRWLDARVLHHALAPLVTALFAEPNPAPLKAVLARLGAIAPALRAPLTPASEGAAQAAWQAYEGAA